MKILVISTLGEVVKKIYELERVLEKEQSAELITSLASLNQIKNSWPVENEDTVIRQISILIRCLDKYQAAEEELMKLSTEMSSNYIVQVVTYYLQQKTLVKDAITQLNYNGRFTGTQFEIEDSNNDDVDTQIVR